jgi:succinoglycan biosynthesis protein ExoM
LKWLSVKSADEVDQSDLERRPGMNAVVGICTFRRPAGLKALLSGLARQTFSKAPRPNLTVLVADNDCDPEISKLLDELGPELDLDLRYIAEKQRGISQARNAILRNVPDDTDWLFLLDDDVVPRTDWMDELLVGVHRTGTEAVCGPMLVGQGLGYPQWVYDGRFFSYPRRKNLPDYADVSFGVMSNCALNARFLRRFGIRFDERFGLVGSEDKAFFDAVLSCGGRMSYTSHAIVDHNVDSSRARLGYLLRREFRVGCGRGLALRYSNPSAPTNAIFVIESALRLTLDTLLLPIKVLVGCFSRNSFERKKPLFDVAQRAGRLYGAFGKRYEQYLTE